MPKLSVGDLVKIKPWGVTGTVLQVIPANMGPDPIPLDEYLIEGEFGDSWYLECSLQKINIPTEL